MSNLPPGVTNSMLPGWHDTEVDIDFYCDHCEEEWTEYDYTVDGRGDSFVESVCPKCKKAESYTWNPPQPDYDDRDDLERYPAQDHPYY
jgi:hypothetical protein